jgi:hypothetical protein
MASVGFSHLQKKPWDARRIQNGVLFALLEWCHKIARREKVIEMLKPA